MNIWFEDMYGYNHRIRTPQREDGSVTIGEEWYLVGRSKDCDFQIEIPSRNILAKIVAEELAQGGDKTVEFDPNEPYQRLTKVYESVSRRHILLERPKPSQLPAQHSPIRKIKCIGGYTEINGRELKRDEIALMTRGSVLELGGLSLVFRMDGGENIPEGATVIRLGTNYKPSP